MKKHSRNLLTVLSFAIVLTSSIQLFAQSSSVPNLVNYQGYLTDNDSNPIAPTTPENKSIEFRIYEAATGGDPLWGETQVVTIFKGNFSVLLGNGLQIDGDTPSGGELLAASFDGKDRFLGITPQGEAEFSPRQRIVTSAFAFRSKIAETVVSASIGTSSIEDLSVTEAEISEDSVTETKISDSAVTEDKIADASITSVKIANSSIALEDLVEEVKRQLMPAGTVVAWAGLPSDRVIGTDTYRGVPDGWLLCDGSTFSKENYPELFNSIGHIYGGSANDFKVPNYLGYFLRGQTNGTEDPDRASRAKASAFATTNTLLEGSIQSDQLRAHNHKWSYTETGGGAGDQSNSWDTSTSNQLTRTHNTTTTGGTETRPKNKYVWYIIKAH